MSNHVALAAHGVEPIQLPTHCAVLQCEHGVLNTGIHQALSPNN